MPPIASKFLLAQNTLPPWRHCGTRGFLFLRVEAIPVSMLDCFARQEDAGLAMTPGREIICFLSLPLLI